MDTHDKNLERQIEQLREAVGLFALAVFRIAEDSNDEKLENFVRTCIKDAGLERRPTSAREQWAKWAFFWPDEPELFPGQERAP